MQLSIIIVNYNVKYFLEQCLASVEGAIETIDAEVIVVDNASTDGSIAYLQQRFAWVNFISNEKNEGFAKANNAALQQCKGDYVLFLNPDTILPENILHDCISFFQSRENIGAVGVHMVDGSGKFLPESKRSFPSVFVSFCKLSGLSAIFPQSGIFNKYALGDLDKNAVHAVDVLCGAFMMARKELLTELNGFDESFFMYAEDIDLCYRIKQKGKKNFYLGNKVIIHFKGESSRQKRLKHVLVFYKAMIIFVRKHYSGITGLLMKSLLYIGIFLRGFVSTIFIPIGTFVKSIQRLFEQQHKKIYATGDEQSVAEAMRILKQTSNNIAERTNSATSITNGEVIICTGIFTYKESIEMIMDNKNNNRYKWHGLHTNSIAGSSDKKIAGEVYHL